ncbi:hypothetical protein H8A95_28930 [Bradyrhizobium sp. Pear76]|uniref:hypothetical protein n=1 Tax=Bradyrhizobium oropedii TaxID=1571201 RepID=UPI001E31931F|nr:hypothetical protein [Bradyrhizobium oropedii]MCC8966240.1 hypothetical protein [Bradyrhizobium oropedii]
MAMAGGDTVMVQPMPLEPLPAMPMAARTIAIIPIAIATTPTDATDAFWFATDKYELGLTGFVLRMPRWISQAPSLVHLTEIGLLTAIA